MDDEALHVVTRALEALSKNVERHQAALLLMTSMHMDTLFVLIGRKILSAQEAHERVRRMLDLALNQEELKPAASLLQGLADVLLQYWKGETTKTAEAAVEQADKALEQLLQNWASETKH